MHRYPVDQIKPTNAAFSYIQAKGIDVLTFKTFDRLGRFSKFWKSIFWIFYSPFLVIGKNYDVLYLDDSYPFYPALIKIVSPRSKVVIRLGDLHLMYYYSGWIYRFLHFFERIAWIMADKIIAISDVMADYIESEIGKRPYVVNDPVDPKDFPTRNFQNEGTVMFHGTLTKNKNIDVLLEAARLMPDLSFTVLGDGPDLKRLAYAAPSNVFFLGWIPFKDIPNRIGSCAVGVALRSNNPGNEYVVTSPFLQYGIMAKPCLVTRRAVFGDYEGQFSDVNEMVRKLRFLLKHPEEGERLKKYVLENHDAEKIGEQIWQILMPA